MAYLQRLARVQNPRVSRPQFKKKIDRDSAEKADTGG